MLPERRSWMPWKRAFGSFGRWPVGPMGRLFCFVISERARGVGSAKVSFAPGKLLGRGVGPAIGFALSFALDVAGAAKSDDGEVRIGFFRKYFCRDAL